MGNETLDSFEDGVEIDLDDEREASDAEDGDDEPLEFDDDVDEPLTAPIDYDAATARDSE